jgi:hypothetical protein
MDILRNLFGNVTSGVIRLLVAVGILAASYLFILKPILDTSNDFLDKTLESSNFDQIGNSIDGVGREIRRQVTHSFKVAKRRGQNPKKLVRCIQRANGDVHRIQRCTVKY